MNHADIFDQKNNTALSIRGETIGKVAQRATQCPGTTMILSMRVRFLLSRYLVGVLVLCAICVQFSLLLRSLHPSLSMAIDSTRGDIGQSISRSTELAVERSNYSSNAPNFIGNSNSIGSSNSTGKAVQILASVPWDKRHVISLWTELECFTKDVNTIVISAPEWASDIIGTVVNEARTRIPHLSNATTGTTTIEAQFFVNDRYDAGLWCDALHSVLKRDDDQYDYFVLLNDSIFALREFRGVLTALRSSRNKNLSMTSLNAGVDAEGQVWLESVFRSFSKEGLTKYLSHSCVPSDHQSFCRNKKLTWVRKRCIVDHHEIAMARQFPPDQVVGLYPSDVPKQMWGTKSYPTWVNHAPYWRKLKKMGFPAAKVSYRPMIRSLNHPLLKRCTRHFDWSLLKRLDFAQFQNTLVKSDRTTPMMATSMSSFTTDSEEW